MSSLSPAGLHGGILPAGEHRAWTGEKGSERGSRTEDWAFAVQIGNQVRLGVLFH